MSASPTTSRRPFSGYNNPMDVKAPWRERLAYSMDTMRELSRQTDPQKMVEVYGSRVEQMMPGEGFISLSRRELTAPMYRITRSWRWTEDINPWKSKDRLPLLDRGVLGEWIYGDEAIIVNDLQVAADDPALDHLAGFGSAMVVPLFDQGHALNMVVLFRKAKDAFDPEALPEFVWMSNLFGRATHNLVLRDQVKQAFDAVDRELKVVADIQRSLLPVELPKIPTLDLAAHYETSARAGGDYYDFFALPNGKWGILIADVSGHGTPAAVLMAVTHSIAHTLDGPPDPPSSLFNFINRHLCARYTNGTGTFVTAFYGIYDPSNRTLTYARAGHNPPRIKRCSDGTLTSLDKAENLPLGIDGDEQYTESTATLIRGDSIVFYTDGITEARAPGPSGDLFGVERLDEVLEDCHSDANALIRATLDAVHQFTHGQPPTDDRTVLVAKVR